MIQRKRLEQKRIKRTMKIRLAKLVLDDVRHHLNLVWKENWKEIIGFK